MLFTYNLELFVELVAFPDKSPTKLPDTSIFPSTYPPVKKNGKIQYTGAGLFTIVAEKTDKKGKKWGLLKSYQKGKNGWISLEHTTKQ